MSVWLTVTLWVLSVGCCSFGAWAFGYSQGIKDTEKRWSNAEMVAEARRRETE